MDNKNNTKKKVIITILALVLVAIGILFALKGCQKEEPVIHTHSYKINEEGTWICNEDSDILSNTDKPYVAILENNQPKDILAIDSLSKTKINLGNGTIYKENNNIYYSGNNAQTVIIKTQKVDDKQVDKDNLVINAPNDTVYHYGSSTVVSLDAVATNSFHEYGKVDLITLTKARVVLENPSDVKEIYLDINDSNYSYETTIIALKENVELPRLTRDAVNLEEGEVKTLAIVQKLKDEVKTETNAETNEVIETVLEVQTADDDYVKIENVRKSNDELIIEAFLSPNAKEDDKTKTNNQSTSTITLEEAKEGSSHPASHNTFVSKQDKVIEVVKPTETKEETKQEETKPVVTPTKKEETKPEVTPTEDDKPSTPTHSHSYSYVAISDAQHKGTCSCGSTVTGNHSYGTDNICDICGYEKNAVARIGNTYYQTLNAAFTSSRLNDEIVLLKNVTVSQQLVVDKSLTLNLNGHMINNEVIKQYMINVKNDNTNFVVNGSKNGSGMQITGDGIGGTLGFICINADDLFDEVDAPNNISYTVNGGSYTGNNRYKLASDFDWVNDEHEYGNFDVLTSTNASVTLNNIYAKAKYATFNTSTLDSGSNFHLYMNDCEIEGEEDFAVHVDLYDFDEEQAGCYITNCKITSKLNNCVQTAGGYLVLTDCDFESQELDQPDWSSAAVAVAYDGVCVINGGSYEAPYATSLYVLPTNGTLIINDGTFYGGIQDIKVHSVGTEGSIEINSGTFKNCDFEKVYQTINKDNYDVIIHGGIFDKDPTDYLPLAYKAIKQGTSPETWKVVEAKEVSVDNGTNPIYYMTLGQFRDSVNNGNEYEGNTITVLKDLDYSNESWETIGDYYASGWFAGIFDGNNKKNNY